MYYSIGGALSWAKLLLSIFAARNISSFNVCKCMRHIYMCCVQSVYFCTAFIRSSLRSVGLWCYSFRRTLHNGNERAMCDAAASHSARKLRRIYIYIQTPFTHSARTSRPHTHVHARCVWNHRSECARLTCTQILVCALCSTRTRTRKTAPRATKCHSHRAWKIYSSR